MKQEVDTAAMDDPGTKIFSQHAVKGAMEQQLGKHGKCGIVLYKTKDCNPQGWGKATAGVPATKDNRNTRGNSETKVVFLLSQP